MRHEPPQPGSPQDWMRYARAELALACVALPPGGMYEQLCFHAQQAAEKSIKAVLIRLGISFPKTHSLERLLDLLPLALPRPPELVASAQLSAYATIFRYPGREEPVSGEQHREALRLAEAVVAWAEEYLRASSQRE